MFLRVGFSRCLQALLHWCGFHAAMVKVNGAYNCDALLLKQLLPDICQATGDFCAATAQCSCARLVRWKERLRTSHQTWPPNRPDLSSVDYIKLLRDVQECVYQKQQGTFNIADALWLLIE